MSWMIPALVFSGQMFSFLHMDKGITFVDAPESTRKLWTLKLKISKDRRKGGVDPLELVFMAFTMDWGLAAVWEDVMLTDLVILALVREPKVGPISGKLSLQLARPISTQ